MGESSGTRVPFTIFQEVDVKIASMFGKNPSLHACALMLAASTAAFGADKPVDIGRFEYEGACAGCHGLSGKGDGPMAEQLKSRTPDITILARNNNGIFPYDRVYQTIDGTREVKAHGSREMPIWGRAFRAQSSLFFDTFPGSNTESAARSRLLALTEYIYRLQGK